MAFQSVPNTAQVFISGTQNGEVIGMTFYAFRGSGYNITDLQNLADDMDDWMGTELLPLLSQDYVYDKTVVRGLENEEDLTAEADTNAGAGSVAGDGLSNNVTFAVKRLSGFTGRSARGRVYVTGLAATDLQANENRVNSTFIVNLLQALADIITYIIANGWVDVIVSRYANGSKRTEGVVYSITDWANTDERVDTQRRRLGTGA